MSTLSCVLLVSHTNQASNQGPCDDLVDDAADKDNSEVINTAVIEYPPESGPAAVALQTAWRGFITRRRYVEETTTRQWVVIKVQSLFRARKARKIFSKRARCVSSRVGPRFVMDAVAAYFAYFAPPEEEQGSREAITSEWFMSLSMGMILGGIFDL